MASPRFVVIGTAGHIDHGKTALVTALTGKNTDRLKEEQQRGISIDIDFAPLPFPDGTLIGMVDVPGHERFVRNMLAGASGIDAALLVIDVREGVKPQTLEHAAILELLGVTRGLIALSKIDLVAPDWIPLAETLIRDDLASTPFAQAPVVPVSAKTGAGLEELRAALRRLADEVEPRDSGGAFRLPVDKVFTVQGFGTVVSGTVWRGSVALGDVLTHLPGGQAVRVRGIQVHGRPVEQAQAGQRTALNLTGVERSDVHRGSVIATPGTLHDTRLLDVRLRLLPSAAVGVRHRDRVHVHLGTGEAIGRVLLLEADEVQPGAEAWAQLLLDRPLVCDTGDRFVIRRYSPVTTLGGGRVVNPAPQRLHRRRRAHIIEQLSALDTDSPQGRLLALAGQGRAITPAVGSELGLTEEETRDLLAHLTARGELLAMPSAWFAPRAVEDALQRVRSTLGELHRRHRFEQWQSRRAVIQTALTGTPFTPRDGEQLLKMGEERGWWQLSGAGIRDAEWQVRLTPEEQAIERRLLELLHATGLQGVRGEALCAQFPRRDRIARGILQGLKERGLAVEADADVWLDGQAFTAASQRLWKVFGTAGQTFTVGQARDLLEVSRKAAVLLLERLDTEGVTERSGDARRFQRPPDAGSGFATFGSRSF
ncbi:MAG: selenocysteine-specific translation elongation factor [Thermoflavifilum sp.]|nr:selenocysteine-specific translation elongation factor [Thermoflavifilum sp.]MCL6514162.1 selenocysteine-specific translation elongation factor [Alicyclobacillus sp.]